MPHQINNFFILIYLAADTTLSFKDKFENLITLNLIFLLSYFRFLPSLLIQTFNHMERKSLFVGLNLESHVFHFQKVGSSDYQAIKFKYFAFCHVLMPVSFQYFLDNSFVLGTFQSYWLRNTNKLYIFFLKMLLNLFFNF